MDEGRVDRCDSHTAYKIHLCERERSRYSYRTPPRQWWRSRKESLGRARPSLPICASFFCLTTGFPDASRFLYDESAVIHFPKLYFYYDVNRRDTLDMNGEPYGVAIGNMFDKKREAFVCVRGDEGCQAAAHRTLLRATQALRLSADCAENANKVPTCARALAI